MPLRGLDNVKKAIDDLTIDTNDKVRGVIFQTLGNIQRGTPVDSGRARNNWFVSFGAPSSKVTDSVTGNELLIGDLPKFIIGMKVFFTNNLGYIERLEYDGWSQQAPVGWVRSELVRAKRALGKL